MSSHPQCAAHTVTVSFSTSSNGTYASITNRCRIFIIRYISLHELAAFSRVTHSVGSRKLLERLLLLWSHLLPLQT